MCGAYRWAASFLVLVMLVPAFGPVAMPCAALSEPLHCARQAMFGQSAARQTAQTALPCHAMAQSKAPQSESSPAESSEASFCAVDSCCQDHCCCGAVTSQWAQPASNQLSFFHLLIEPARPIQSARLDASGVSRQDSARAPPRS